MGNALIKAWPWIAQILGLVLAFFVGLSSIRRSRVTLYAVLIGIATNLAIELPDGGPGLCIGMVFFPVLFTIAACLGHYGRMLMIRFNWIQVPPEPPGPACPGCGYCLTGLPGWICPECGRTFTPEELWPWLRPNAGNRGRRGR